MLLSLAGRVAMLPLQESLTEERNGKDDRTAEPRANQEDT